MLFLFYGGKDGGRTMAEEYVGEIFSEIELSNREFQGVIFEDCRFENCKLQELSFIGCRFIGCFFQHCLLAGLKFREIQAFGNRFEECSLAGINWAELLDTRKREMGFLPFDVLLRCEARHCVFYGLDLRKQDFSQCDFSGSYFEECNLSETSFRQARLRGTSFSHNNLRSADFRGAEEYLFSLENNQVQKARFSLPEAVNLLAALGIILEEL